MSTDLGFERQTRAQRTKGLILTLLKYRKDGETGQTSKEDFAIIEPEGSLVETANNMA